MHESYCHGLGCTVCLPHLTLADALQVHNLYAHPHTRAQAEALVNDEPCPCGVSHRHVA